MDVAFVDANFVVAIIGIKNGTFDVEINHMALSSYNSKANLAGMALHMLSISKLYKFIPQQLYNNSSI